jgi:phosphoribosylaminoimidazole-succinocarboxamide synthase
MAKSEFSKEKIYKDRIRKNLANVLESGFVPELGRHKKGKVRDVHFASEKEGSPIIMVASDRVSAFDHQIAEPIPYKGRVLNLFAKWSFDNSADIIPNALIESPHPNVVIQKRYEVVGFEFVVRGYVWGSMAGAYEKGEREFCGIKMPEGLLRYQKLPEPILTPATKFGVTDENVSFEYVEKEIGIELAGRLRDAAIKLFKRAGEMVDKRGFVFLDTKYEFGKDTKGNIYLIDEANTPDSSRYCTKEEYRKFEAVKKEMASGKYKNVSELLNKKPELKIEELSKQFVRDVLVESGFSYGSQGEVPHLSPDQVVETAYRYISLYENVTGETFDFGTDTDVRQGLISSLTNSGYLKGGFVLIMAGSDSDGDHVVSIQKELDKYGIPSTFRICSAHKQGAECTEIVKEYNKSVEPVMIVAVAGGTDALSGLASFHSVWPVVSCPPNKNEYSSCVTNPPGSSNALILRPGNVARFAAQYFGYSNKEFHKQINTENKKKIDSLVEADKKHQ